MSGKNFISIIWGVIGILLGIIMIVMGVTETTMPKVLWIIMALICISNGIISLRKRKTLNKMN